MRILGIDPGIRCTGYGLISIDGGQPHLVDYGTIKPPPAATMGERLAVIYDDLDQLIDMTHPDEFAIEEAFHGVNARSALILGQSRGAALVCAAHHHLPIGQYAPRRVKIATTGSGRATKEQVQYMVQRILGIDQPPTPLDASDALAVAICHHQTLRLEGLRA
ncbi:MAG: crossover junction endodeoxyribonuclease RuvC [Candidatus Marinimicrobia bacterium]|nr:crossover junction endodeoxyribonuclease RuvC [Candidatus Neomarinimicrobiota bacterium]MCH7851373.1 crossover junction endodeoxyribonuclease RuvC [Candidatus Neomarinimicrobiota bacterium]